MPAVDETGVPYSYDHETGASQYEDPYVAPYGPPPGGARGSRVSCPHQALATEMKEWC